MTLAPDASAGVVVPVHRTRHGRCCAGRQTARSAHRARPQRRCPRTAHMPRCAGRGAPGPQHLGRQSRLRCHASELAWRFAENFKQFASSVVPEVVGAGPRLWMFGRELGLAAWIWGPGDSEPSNYLRGVCRERSLCCQFILSSPLVAVPRLYFWGGEEPFHQELPFFQSGEQNSNLRRFGLGPNAQVFDRP